VLKAWWRTADRLDAVMADRITNRLNEFYTGRSIRRRAAAN